MHRLFPVGSAKKIGGKAARQGDFLRNPSENPTKDGPFSNAKRPARTFSVRAADHSRRFWLSMLTLRIPLPQTGRIPASFAC